MAPASLNVVEVNENHRRLCPSPKWAAFLHTEVLPGVVDGVDLGRKLIEIGPGPGAATNWLRHRVELLVAVERDRRAADSLAANYVGGNVKIVCGDGAALGFGTRSFDSAGCFTMLHHVPTLALQNAVLGEMLRVLRPGGTLVGSDSVPSDDLRRFHLGDTYNPVDPGTFGDRLRDLGFERITVHTGTTMRFTARKPDTERNDDRTSMTRT